MAESLIRSAGYENRDDWSEIAKLVRNEMGDYSTNIECAIKTSLKVVKGSEDEQQNVRNALLLFALVPEDTPNAHLRCSR